MFFKTCVSKNFANFTGIKFNKVAGLQEVLQRFSCEICKNFENAFFYRRPLVAATEAILQYFKNYQEDHLKAFLTVQIVDPIFFVTLVPRTKGLVFSFLISSSGLLIFLQFHIFYELLIMFRQSFVHRLNVICQQGKACFYWGYSIKSILIHEYQHKSTRVNTNQHESTRINTSLA